MMIGMKNPQAARFLLALAMALVFSNCSSPSDPFFRFNSPFEKKGPVGYEHLENYGNGEAETPGDRGNQPSPYFDGQHTPEPRLANLSADPVASTGAGTPQAPKIQTHKRGPAGSTCFTCRGKGYVFQPTTDSTGDNYSCPACGGDGRY
jgi:hypothetical protein